MANNPAQYKASDYARQFQQSPTGNRTFVAPNGTTAELTPELYALPNWSQDNWSLG